MSGGLSNIRSLHKYAPQHDELEPNLFLRQKFLADFSNFSPKCFGPKLAEKKKSLSKVGMGNKL